MEAAFSRFLLDADKCRFLLDSPGEEASIAKVSILIDVGAKGKWQGPQTPHIDWLLDGRGNIIVRRGAIAPATTGCFSLLIYDKSHKMLRQAADWHDWHEDWGFFYSSVRKDKAFCKGKTVKEPSRIWVDKGQILVFDGFLVHAGDESRMLPDMEVLPNLR